MTKSEAHAKAVQCLTTADGWAAKADDKRTALYVSVADAWVRVAHVLPRTEP